MRRDAAAEPDGPGGPKPAGLSRGFHALWLSQTLSLLGNQVAIFAIPTSAILELRAAPLEVGLLQAAPHVPILLFGFLVGAWIDQRRKRRLMLATEWGRAGVLASVPLATVAGALTLPHLYLVSALNGTAIFITLIAYQAYLRHLVPESRLVEANAKVQLSQGAAVIIGPAAAGVFIATWGAGTTVLITSVAALASGAVLLLLGQGEQQPSSMAGVPTPSIGVRVREGIRFVWTSRILRPVLFQAGMITMAVYAMYSVLLIFAYRDLGLSPAEFGIAQGVGSIGWILAALLVAPAAALLGLGRTLTVACGLVGFGLLTMSSAGVWSPLIALAAGQLLLSAAWPSYNVTEASLRQIIVPESILGRASAATRWLRSAVIVLVAPTAGVAAGALGAGVVIVGAGLIALLAVGWTVFTGVDRVHDVAGAKRFIATDEVLADSDRGRRVP